MPDLINPPDKPSSPPPGKWWPPDRKVWAGGIAGIAAYTILSYFRAWTGVDLNVFNPVLGTVLTLLGWPPMDVTGALSIIVGMAVSQITIPKAKDLYLWIDNKVIAMANADDASPVKAKEVSEEESLRVAKIDAALGRLPPEIAAKVE